MTRGRAGRTWRSWASLALLPLVLSATDFAIRHQEIAAQKPIFHFYLAFSYVFEALVLLAVLRACSSERLRVPWAVVLALLVTLAQIAGYGAYHYFGVMPNTFLFGYILDHAENSASLFWDSVHRYHFVLAAGLLGAYYALLLPALRAVRGLGRRWWLGASLFLVLASLVLNNNVRHHPAAFPLFTSAAFAGKYVVQNRYFHAGIKINEGSMRRRASVPAVPPVRPRYSCLLVVSESVGRGHLGYYGYERDTSPFVQRLAREGRVVLLDGYHANANVTECSVPILMSGIYSVKPVQAPFIQDYLKAWAGVETFWFSSQAMKTRQVDVIFDTAFDRFVCQENSGLPACNDKGADDWKVLGLLKEHLDRVKGPFFGVLQLNNSHYPYRFGEAYARFLPPKPGGSNAFDNALVEQDAVLQDLFAALKASGRLETTAVLFVSDHGEAFGEHGKTGHLASLYDQVVKVPGWIYLPPGFDPEKRAALLQNRATNKSHLDVLPTVLDLLGCLHRERLARKVDGASWFGSCGEDRVIPFRSPSIRPESGVVWRGYKFIRSEAGGDVTERLFDRASDPGEERDLWRDAPADLKKKLQAEEEFWRARSERS